MKPYYYVFKSGGNPPSKPHETAQSAIKESERFALLHPGQTFEVCMCIAITSTPRPVPSTFFMDGIYIKEQ